MDVYTYFFYYFINTHSIDVEVRCSVAGSQKWSLWTRCHRTEICIYIFDRNKSKLSNEWTFIWMSGTLGLRLRPISKQYAIAFMGWPFKCYLCELFDKREYSIYFTVYSGFFESWVFYSLYGFFIPINIF